jgi:hypothetical protein
MVAGIFLKVDVDFAANKDIAKLRRYGRDTRAVRDLLVQMWCYCKRHRTDGHIPSEEIGVLVYPDTERNGIRDADRLVEVGIAERTDAGYYLPDFLRHNKSAVQIAEESRIKAERGRRGGIRSGEARRGEADSQADAKQDASQTGSTETSSASTPLNTETETEPETEPKPSSLQVSGGRTETLRAVPATSPPKDSTCSRHPDGNPTNEPCGGCKRVEDRKRRNDEKAAERRQREDEDRARNCPTCEGTYFVLDGDKLPTRRKCDHRRSA